jgi:hypothetical protein
MASDHTSWQKKRTGLGPPPLPDPNAKILKEIRNFARLCQEIWTQEELTQQGELTRNAKGYQLNLPSPVSRPIDPQGNGNGKRSGFVQ